MVADNQRALDAVVAMEAGDRALLGALMNASHASLRDDFEVSSPALDAIVELAQNTPGCLGARMTGGGLAGAAVALVEEAQCASFVASVASRFVAPSVQPSTAPVELFVVRPCAGASVVAAPASADLT